MPGRVEQPGGFWEHPFDGGLPLPAPRPSGHYLGEYVVAVPDWSEGDPFTDKEGRRFRIVSIDAGNHSPFSALQRAV